MTVLLWILAICLLVALIIHIRRSGEKEKIDKGFSFSYWRLPEKVYKNAVVYSAGCTRHYPGACGVSLLCDHPRVRSLHFGGYSGTGNLQL